MIRGTGSTAFHVCIRTTTAAVLIALSACGGGGTAGAIDAATGVQGTAGTSIAAATPSAQPAAANSAPATSSAPTMSPPAAHGLVASPADVANTTIAGTQTVRSIGTLSDGGWAVTWMSQDSSGSSAMFVQRYDASGAKSGSEVRVDYAVAPQEAPAIAVLRDGSIVVASVSADGHSVFMRRFDAQGAAASTNVAIATSAQDTLAQPVLLALDDGGLAAGWASQQQPGVNAQHVQRFDSRLQPTGAQQDFAATDSNHNVSLKLVEQPGGFVAGVTHRFQGISYVQFRIGGRDVGPLDDANAGLPEFNTTLTPLADGRYILWSTGGAGGYMQMLDGGGRASGTSQALAVVPETAVGLPDGGWVSVVRQLYGAPSLAQRFDGTGAKVGGTVEMSAGMSRPLVVSNLGNGFALAWSFTGAQGDSDVKTQRVQAD